MDIILDKILYMNIAAFGLIPAVILVRSVFQKAPKYIRCILWALVAIRLVCPFSIETAFSLVPSIDAIQQQVNEDDNEEQDSQIVQDEQVDEGNVEIIEDSEKESSVEQEDPIVNDENVEEIPDNTEYIDDVDIVSVNIYLIIWLFGMAVILLHSVISYFRLKKRVSTSTYYDDRIWVSDEVETPFILGVLRPRIYLPSGMDGEIKKYVLAHEYAHISRKDYIWKPLGFLIVCVHWFNPLVWVAYVLFSRDIEMACDEKVIKNYDVEERKAYSKALLACSASNRSTTECPVAFSEVGVKGRVKSALNYKKPAFWLIIVALFVCIAMAAGFLTNPKDKDAVGTNINSTQQPIIIDAGKSYSVEELGINLVVSDITATGLTLKCSLENAEYGMYSASNEYYLERYENDTWIEVEMISTAAFTRILPFNGEKEWEFDWEDLYGELDAGRYRLAKPIWFSNAPISSSFGDKYIFYKEFIVLKNMTSQGSAIKASQKLDVIMSINEDGSTTYPDEYAGCYIAGAKLIILLTDTSDEMIKKYTDIVGDCSDYIEIEKAEYSYNYLYSETQRLAQLIIDNNLTWYHCGVSQSNNSIEFGVVEEDYEAIMKLLGREDGNLPIEVTISSPVELM